MTMIVYILLVNFLDFKIYLYISVSSFLLNHTVCFMKVNAKNHE